MNLPNKITITRIILAILLLILLVFPFYQVGVEFPTYYIASKIALNLKYIIAGIVFMIASFSDFLDGNIARKRGIVTDFGKIMDAIADKILVNGVLIVLAVNGYISVIIPVVIVTRDIVVDSVRMASAGKGKVIAAGWLGKVKTVCMMIGISLLLFSNLPFELWNIRVAELLIFVATVLSVVSGCQYFIANKDFIFAEK
ncbi:MAG TPA: CDP-diacylglycerol--glycerol-3-phosphate 3-phosphatidyltransferase [Bacilli bacterium]|nr:CDP-diacylglycerol--glycerol-3-phosphate 3-phosphatidyltransferase [Bacilli bacterium]